MALNRPQCVECNKTIDPDDPGLHIVDGPAGGGVKEYRKSQRGYWHPECFDQVTYEVERRLADRKTARRGQLTV